MCWSGSFKFVMDLIIRCTTTITTSSAGFFGYGAHSAYNATSIISSCNLFCEGESSCRNVDYLEFSYNLDANSPTVSISFIDLYGYMTTMTILMLK